MLKILALLCVLFTVQAQASQVLMSCDFSGLQDVDNLQVRQTDAGLQVKIFMISNDVFTLPLLPIGETDFSNSVDLGGFNTFNDLESPKLTKLNGQWYFESIGETAVALSCATLN